MAIDSEKKFSAFKANALSDWEVAAREELEGADPWQKLTHHSQDWSVKPFYGPRSGNPPSPLLVDSKNIFLGPRAWYNCPRIVVKDEKSANAAALATLQQGADGIYFELEQAPDLEVLLKDIQWQFCSLNFLAKKNSDTIGTSLARFISERKNLAHDFHGTFFGEPFLKEKILTPFRFSGIHSGPSTPVDELVSAFTMVISSLRGKVSAYAATIAISISLGEDIFPEMCKLRAARTLWSKILEWKKFEQVPLYLHGYSLPPQDPVFEPHGNMLKTASAGIIGVLGGCDAITLLPETDQTMMARIAANVSSILREESHLSKVADPVAGSWLIEDLTLQLTEAVWKQLQTKAS